MESSVVVLGEELEYDFLSAWIKYTRIKNRISQEALSHGICSTSHLSYFENGKKHLRKEIIEALLKKLNINKIDKFADIGLFRLKLNTMMNDVESMNYDGAKAIYNELIRISDIINLSPYNIEFKIYDLMFQTFVENKSYDCLKNDLNLIDKIYVSLNDNLKYLYLLASGNILYKNHDFENGIRRQQKALLIKDTSWINFTLGKALCFNNNPGKGSYYLEKALNSYERSGRYLNAVWCHNYLGVCFSYLKIYENSEKHFNAALMSAKHFNMNKLLSHVYTNLSDLYFCKGDYIESTKWSKLALETEYKNIVSVYNYTCACIKLGKIAECDKIFDKYLTGEFGHYNHEPNEVPQSRNYYHSLYFLYLVVHKFNDPCFYEEVKYKILPYYENVKKTDICRDIKLKLIEYLENNRRYKDAAKLYKELI